MFLFRKTLQIQNSLKNPISLIAQMDENGELIWRYDHGTNIQIEVGKGIPEKAEDLKGGCGHCIPIKIEMPNQDHKPSPPDSTGDDSEFKHRSNLLIPAFAAAITLFEAFHLPGVGNYLDSTIFSVFVLINTIVFFISMASITMVMRKLPIIPWLIISVSSTIGLYICAILANSPGEIVPVLFIGGFIFLAAFFQFLPTFHVM